PAGALYTSIYAVGSPLLIPPRPSLRRHDCFHPAITSPVSLHSPAFVCFASHPTCVCCRPLLLTIHTHTHPVHTQPAPAYTLYIYIHTNKQATWIWTRPVSREWTVRRNRQRKSPPRTLLRRPRGLASGQRPAVSVSLPLYIQHFVSYIY
ncbi:hypothetical protein H106_07793, partial [Trichophyton rubrum CBS 735.88]